jgi:hypothetical protein
MRWREYDDRCHNHVESQLIADDKPRNNPLPSDPSAPRASPRTLAAVGWAASQRSVNTRAGAVAGRSHKVGKVGMDRLVSAARVGLPLHGSVIVVG